MENIILTSPYNEITKMAKELSWSLGLEIRIIESALDEAVELIKPYVNDDEEAILISRGATANLLEKEFPHAHLLRAEPTEYDVIQALYEAKQTNKKIGFFGTTEEEVQFKVEHLAKMIEINVIGYWYSNSVDFYQQVEQAKNNSIEVVIGGGMRGQLMCEERGIAHISLISGRTTIYQTLARVKDIIETKRKEQESSAFIRTVVDLSHEGITAINGKKEVVVLNHEAARLFRINPKEIVNKSIDQLIGKEHFTKLFKGSPNGLGELHEIPGAKLLVNRAPYRLNNEEGIVVTFQDITQIQESEQKIRRELYQKGLVAKYSFDDIIHTSLIMKKIITKAQRFSKVDGNVLIIGESGTGKELMAQSIHNAHPRRKKGPFVAINCTALTDNLLESELFGYEQGSFTGADKKGKPGLFELAHGGTIFLDEIGKISLDLQSKLLRVLQEREVRRIGGDRNIPIDVRVIAAANENIQSLMEEGKFRIDLYYRLEVLVLRLPALRDKKEDIPKLIDFMLQKYASIYKKEVVQIDQSLIRQMSQLEWPGNLRQLENMVERCMVMADQPEDVNLLIRDFLEEEPVDKENDNKEINHHTYMPSITNNTIMVNIGSLNEMQQSIVELLLERKTNKKELAKELGVSRTTLWKMINDINQNK